MKLIVNKKEIERAVKNLCRVINPKNALPILGDILCEVDEQERTMRMTASDSEIWLLHTIALESAEGGGKFCVPATRLMDALGELSEQPLTIIATTESDMKFTLQHSTGETFFPCENADEYPQSPELKDISTLWMEPRELATAITSTAWATANDDLRPVMSGVEFNFTKEQADITASDGHALMLYRIKKDYGCEGSFIMPKKVAKMLPQMLTMDEDEEVNVIWNDREAIFEQCDWTLTFRLIEGKYPNYESVIPKDQVYWSNLSRLGLLNSLRKVSPFTNDSSNMVRLTFEREQLHLQAEDYDFSTGATDRMYADCNVIDPLCIGFKASTLVAILSKMPYSDVVVHMSDPSRAVTIDEKPEEGKVSKTLGNIIGLAMPMMLNE